MVKYGTELKGFNVDKLVVDLTDPIKNCKFHLLTDRPLYENNIRNIGLSDNDIRTHQHWVKTQLSRYSASGKRLAISSSIASRPAIAMSISRAPDLI